MRGTGGRAGGGHALAEGVGGGGVADVGRRRRGTVGGGESAKTQFSLSPGGSLNKTSIGGNGNTVSLYIEPTQEAGFITIIRE